MTLIPMFVLLSPERGAQGRSRFQCRISHNPRLDWDHGWLWRSNTTQFSSIHYRKS